MPRPSPRKRPSKKGSLSSLSTTRLRRAAIALVTAGLAALQVTHCTDQADSPPAPPTASSAPRSTPGAARDLVQTRFADCPQHFAIAPPQVPRWPTLRELCFTDFAVLHSGQTRTPVFVAERLSRKSLARGDNLKRTDRFYEEARLPSAERAELDDYKGSGYSRGHMAPAADMASAKGMAQSFSLANMVPQDQRNNSGVWAKIEEDTRRYVERAKGDVYVLTGPVFTASSPTIGGRVRVPTHLFKLVYDPATGRSWAHWVANRADAEAGQPISYDELERRTGMDLLPRVQTH